MKPSFCLSLSAALLGLGLSSACGQGVALVKDINAAAQSPSSHTASLISANGALYLSVETNIGGAELWKSDGTANGTALLRDIIPGPASSKPLNLTAVGTKLFFSAINSNDQRSLWVTDGTSQGTVQVKTDLVYPGSTGPEKLVSYNNLLFFEGYSSAAEGRELWRSDGTANGTFLVKNINTVTNGHSNISDFYPAGGLLYFVANDGVNGRELWRTNGTTAGTVMVHNLGAGSSDGFPSTIIKPTFAQLGTKLYFTASATDAGDAAFGAELYQTEASIGSGATLVTDILTGLSGSTPGELTVMGNFLYFSAETINNGRELWRSNGSTSNAELMIDIASLSDSSNPEQLIVLNNNILLFTASDSSGRHLWRSNGSTGASNNQKVSAAASDPANFIIHNNELLFTALNGGNLILYKTNGTVGNFNVVYDLPETEGASSVSHMTLHNGKVYFLLNNSELWVTDGTTAGTSQVKDFLGGSGSSNPENLTLASNDKVYFSATDGTHGRELWVTDGTEAGTNLVKDIATDSNSSSPQWLTPANNDKVFFSADDTGSNRELWITDGTTEGTALVKDIRVDGASEPKNLAFINNHLYFSADDGVNGRELWISDGTEAGTRMVTNLAPGATSSNPEQIVGYKGEVYFVANGSDGIELRKTNGTAEGTSLVRNIGPGGNSSSPQGLVVLTTSSGQSLLLFSANTAANGRELWKSNGTLDGTVMVRDIKPGGAASNPDQLTVVGNTLFFTADDGVNGVELWKSSGSEGGTSMVKNIAAGAASSSPKYLTEVGGKLFFVADDGVRGEELWVSNGTASGTVLVKDIVPGAGSPGIENLCNVDGVLCFSADDGVNGRELWVSDGTSAGTFILEDLTGDSSGSLPSHLIKYDGQLMFAATDYAYGNELRLAFVGPNIQVEHPAETPLTEPVDFGPVAYGSSAKQTITIRNNGRNILKSIKAQISGLNAAEFTLVKPLPKTSISPNTTTEVIVQFKPKEGGPRTATLTVFSNDGDEPAINITLNGSGEKDPYFTAQPVSRLVHAGDSVNFSGTVSSGSPLSYQWRKNGKKIAGATGTEFGIFSPTLSDAGAYTLLAQGSPLNAISNPAQLGVVVNEPTILAAGLGKKATLKVSAAGNNLSYRWKCGPDLNNLNPITDSALVTGSASKTLVLKALTLEDTAVYACEVTGPGGSLLGGTTVLSVFNAVPDVLPQSFEKGIVSGYYEHTILVDDDPTKAPLTYYTAKKLPSGLKLNSKTGVISGRPLKAGSFFVTLGAKNSFGKDEEKDIPLDIDPFPENIVGSYSGLVKRHDNLNGSLGGRIDLKITGTGVFSGSLVLGTTKYALKGALDVDVDKIAPPSIKLTIPRKGKPAPEPLTLNLTLSPDTSSFAGTVYTTDDTVDVEGWLQLPAADVPAYQGYHTFGMSPKTLDFAADEMPQGWSYGSFTVAKKTGKLKLAGKTADGEKITCSSVVGKDGQVLLFQTLYKPAGSLLGKLTLAKGTDEVNAADNTISGEVDWSRPASTSSKARVYKSGFGMPNLDLSTPLVLDVKGSFYPPTDAFFPGPKTAKLQFRLDQESLPETSPDITVDITSANKVVLPSSNPGAVSLKINAKTGVLSGSFTPVDDYTYKGKPHKRKTSFAGILIQNEGVNQGVGYFLLADPPTESLTPSTTPMQGGSVELLEQGLPPD